ncbi:hypothetical protein JCM18899A_35360 [Nocardioides sp. AN3]
MSSDQQSAGVTWFDVTSGRVTGVLGLVAAAIVVVVGVVDAHVPGVIAGLIVAVLTWLVLLRPRVGMSETDLLLRGIVTTVVIPLASVESVAVRQVLAVWADGRRYVNAAIGRTFREINRQRRGAGTVEDVPSRELKYADHVTTMITDRSRTARRDGAPMGPVRREWAWLELALLVALVVAEIAALLLI